MAALSFWNRVERIRRGFGSRATLCVPDHGDFIGLAISNSAGFAESDIRAGWLEDFESLTCCGGIMPRRPAIERTPLLGSPPNLPSPYQQRRITKCVSIALSAHVIPIVDGLRANQRRGYISTTMNEGNRASAPSNVAAPNSRRNDRRGWRFVVRGRMR